LSVGGLLATKTSKKLVHVSSGSFVNTGGGVIGVASLLTSNFDTVSTNRNIVQIAKIPAVGNWIVLATLFTGNSRIDKRVYHD